MKPRRTGQKASRSAAAPPIDLAAVREFAAAHLPGASVNGKFGGASFFVGGKVFAFSRPKGLVLKLPPDAIAHTLASRKADHLTMGKRVMREWLLLKLDSREEYVHEQALLLQAMQYVSTLNE